MRNYHLGEIENYLYQFQCIYELRSDAFLPCTCDFFICFHAEFEPRVRCKRCTKHFRNTEQVDSDKLCLICQTCSMLAHDTRPTKDDHFSFSDAIIRADGDLESAELKIEQELLERFLAKTKFRLLPLEMKQKSS
ncbi:unnamed protein product [Caenorhabditis brenneri]